MAQYWKKIKIGLKQDISVTEDKVKMQQQSKEKKIVYSLKQISGSFHLRSLSMGFQIEYTQNSIQTFFVYFRTKKMQPFQGILPFGINQNWTLRSAVLFFGEPQIKSKHMVEVIYDNLGLGIVFLGSWERDDSVIDYCYFFQPSLAKLCSSCKNQILNIFWSCTCKGVKYCSQKCRKKHLGLHKIICQQIDEQ